MWFHGMVKTKSVEYCTSTLFGENFTATNCRPRCQTINLCTGFYVECIVSTDR